jgi:hypothetical protein
MPTTPKAAVKKKTTSAKKPVARKSTAKKNVKKNSAMKSFRVYPNARPFVTFKPTKQTAYWIVLLVLIIVLQLWMLKIQLDIIDLANSISAQ